MNNIKQKINEATDKASDILESKLTKIKTPLNSSTEHDLEWIDKNLSATEEEALDYAEKAYPSTDYPELYVPVNYDMQPSLHADGHLFTGEKKTVLKQTMFSADLYKDAVKTMNGINRKSTVYAFLFSVWTALLAMIIFIPQNWLMKAQDSVVNSEMTMWGAKAVENSLALPNLFSMLILPIVFVGVFLGVLNVSIKAIEANKWSTTNGFGLMLTSIGGLITLALISFVFFDGASQASTLSTAVNTSIEMASSNASFGSYMNGGQSNFDISRNHVMLSIVLVVLLVMLKKSGFSLGMIAIAVLLLAPVFIALFSIASSPLYGGIAVMVSGIILLLASSHIVRKTSQAKSVESLANGAIEEKSSHLNIPTKDEYTRYIQRRKERESENFAHKKQIEKQSHIANEVRMLVGYSTGEIRSAGALASKEAGMPIVMNGDDLAQNILLFGGTGSGKTAIALNGYIEQLLNSKDGKYDIPFFSQENFKYSAFIMDAKGTFYLKVIQIAKKLGRLNDVVLIGTNSNNQSTENIVAKNINILSGLSPIELSNIVMSTSNAEGDGITWVKKAGKLISNVAFIAQALNDFEEAKLNGAKPYSLNWIYTVASSDKAIEAMLKILNKLIADGLVNENTKNFHTVKESISYLEGTWASYADETKSSIVGNVSDLLGDLPLSEELNMLYGKGNTDENTIDIADIFDGKKIFVFNLTTAKDGEVAALIMKMIKAQFYRASLIRLEEKGSEYCANNPVFTMYDEAQEILTAGEGGVTDTQFWNKARETGVHAIIATQTKSALVQALGEHNTENFIDQMRTKIIMNNEDLFTMKLIEELMGKSQSSKIYDQQMLGGQRRAYESIEELQDSIGGRILDTQPITSISEKGHIAQSINYATHEYNSVDKRLAVWTPSSGDGQADTSESDYMKQLAELEKRKQDKDSEFLREGNDYVDLYPAHKVIELSNWQAVVIVKQSGHVTKDVIRMKPHYEDFTWKPDELELESEVVEQEIA